MLVCHCKGLTDREIHGAIRAGASTHREVARECGAGSICGGCRPLIDELLESGSAPSTCSGLEPAESMGSRQSSSGSAPSACSGFELASAS